MQQDQPVAQHNNVGRTLGIIGGVIGLVLLCGLIGYFGGWLATTNLGSATTTFEPVTNDGNKIVSKNEQTLASVIEKVSPSVVSIITSSGSSSFLGYTAQSAGTGVVLSKDGYIMTNKHVISGASQATVVTSDGTTHDNVRVVGTDPLNDLAFLKINNVDNLTPAALGDSKTIRIGQNVVAIGNALGQYQNTVTSGVISGLGRPVIASSDESGRDAESLNDLIQTDAAINSGNSGGPLINLQGQVVGINTAVASDAQSIGFAIPIGAAKGAIKQLLAAGNVKRAIIGVQYVSITPEIKSEYKLPVSKGDYVVAEKGTAVRAGSPAARAGIKDKDIITKVNGVEVGPGKSVSTLVGEFRPGDTVRLTVLRGGTSQEISLKLTAY